MKLNIEGIKGCTDHGCIFGHPGGMGTNGGCHCLEMRPTAERLRIERNVRLLIRAIQDLRNDLTAARLELENTEGRLGSYLRDNERLRWDISRLNMRCEAMGWRLYPYSDPAREAVAGDIGWPI